MSLYKNYYKINFKELQEWIYGVSHTFNAFEKYTIIYDPTCSLWPIIAIFTDKQFAEGMANSYTEWLPDKAIVNGVSCWHILSEYERICREST